MNNARAQILIDQIDKAINDINGFSNISDLEKSYLAKFLVVFISGIYEEIIETIINDSIAKKATPEIINYVKETIHEHFRNPNQKNIKKLLGKFSKKWVSNINSLPQKILLSLDSIINNKNSLSHGGTTTLTLADVLDYYKDSRTVIETIDQLV